MSAILTPFAEALVALVVVLLGFAVVLICFVVAVVVLVVGRVRGTSPLRKAGCAVGQTHLLHTGIGRHDHRPLAGAGLLAAANTSSQVRILECAPFARKSEHGYARRGIPWCLEGLGYRARHAPRRGWFDTRLRALTRIKSQAQRLREAEADQPRLEALAGCTGKQIGGLREAIAWLIDVLSRGEPLSGGQL